MDRAWVINLIGAPGSGKSTVAAQLFARLKYHNVDCEMALEYAKERLWEGTLEKTSQLYIFARQEERLRNIRDKVDVIVTDAPHIHSFVYNTNETGEFYSLVKRTFLDQNNMNVLLYTPPETRDYDPRGRQQDKEGSDMIQDKLKRICDDPSIIDGKYIEIDPFHNKDHIDDIIDHFGVLSLSSKE